MASEYLRSKLFLIRFLYVLPCIFPLIQYTTTVLRYYSNPFRSSFAPRMPVIFLLQAVGYRFAATVLQEQVIAVLARAM